MIGSFCTGAGVIGGGPYFPERYVIVGSPLGTGDLEFVGAGTGVG